MTEQGDLAGPTSKKGWVKADYDRSIWIPCPPAFRADMTREEWASGFARLWWDASGLKYGKRQVEGLRDALVYLHESIYGHQPCHLVLIHLPDVRLAPLPVCFGIWESVGDRDSQLRMLVHADDPAAVEPPMVEDIQVRSLGVGLRCLYYQKEREGSGVLASLNYAWRSEEFETDLRLFTSCPDLGRLQRAMPDIETLTQAITLVPRAQLGVVRWHASVS